MGAMQLPDGRWLRRLPVDWEMRSAVYTRDGMTCRYCGVAVHQWYSAGWKPSGELLTRATLDHIDNDGAEHRGEPGDGMSQLQLIEA